MKKLLYSIYKIIIDAETRTQFSPNFLGKITVRELFFSWGALTISFIFLLSLLTLSNTKSLETIISPILATLSPLKPLEEVKKGNEVFGFAPYWTLQKLDNVDFDTLTTLAYFGVPIDADGSLDKDDVGYQKFQSEKATELFKKAHDHNTRVVLTVTIMDNDTIEEFLSSPEAQKRAIHETADEVKKRGIDGVNVDVEYVGTPEKESREQFSVFVKNITDTLHKEVPGSRVTVSVYAASVKGKKLYDIASLGKNADGVFMMAYDFATTGSDNVIPTSPLYGYKEGKYWYDVSTAVEDFLTLMPANKLILGLPWYGYNYPVSNPKVKAPRYEGYEYAYWVGRKKRWASFRPSANAQTYAVATNDITVERSGWDDVGKVGWKAYQTDGIWRMIFLDDERSLKLKYQFAKDKNLAGVGMWALGFDNGRDELWDLLRQEFGEKLADSRISTRDIKEGI